VQLAREKRLYKENLSKTAIVREACRVVMSS